jgi:hypothetical protein
MTFAGVNYLAIIVAAVVAWIAGAVWYMALGKAWMGAHGWASRAEAPKRTGLAAGAPFVISFIAEIVMAWVLAGLIAHLGPGQLTVRNGIISAAFVWLGFVATTVTVNNAYPGKPWLLTLIDAGHWLVVLLLMGAVIGAFGV